MPHGYSGTPLARKLGLKPGMTARLIQAPDHYLNLFDDWPEGVLLADDPETKKDFIHVFVQSEAQLLEILPAVRKELVPAGMIWVSWLKKNSGRATDVDGNVIREAAALNDLVDIKVCAVDADWSGLKLVIPVKLR